MFASKPSPNYKTELTRSLRRKAVARRDPIHVW